jgi:hypothetical protein
MKINVEELEWVLIKRCENFSKVEIGKDKAPMYWFDAGDRGCINGTIGVPTEYLTEKGKKKVQIIRVPCTVCHGSGYLPTSFGLQLSRVLNIINQFDEDGTAIQDKFVESRFIERKSGLYGDY